MAYDRPIEIITRAVGSTEFMALPEEVFRSAGVSLGGIPNVLDLLREAGDEVVSATGRPWLLEEVTETFRSNRRSDSIPALVLNRAPVQFLTSVIVDGTTLSLTDDVVYNPKTGELFRLSGTSIIDWTGSVIAVSYGGGYYDAGRPECDLPRTIRRATSMLAAHWYSQEGTDQTLQVDDVPDVGRRVFRSPTQADNGLPGPIAGLLRPFKRQRI